MRNGIKIMSLLTVAMGMFCSCDLEKSDAGRFGGMWHLVRVDTLATGGVLDMSKERVFWSFQYRLMEADDRDNRYESVIMRYSDENGELTLSKPYIYDRSDGDKPIVDDTELHYLRPYGINKLTESYRVLSVSGSKMQLQSEKLKLLFRKF